MDEDRLSANPQPEKSLSVAIEQLAQLLRSEVKISAETLKNRQTKILPSTHSLHNTVVQVAKLLRTEAQSIKPVKKTKWSKRPSKKTKSLSPHSKKSKKRSA